MKVFVYFNLHKKVWSVKALEGPNKGRVIQHSTFVALTDCTFKVSKAGRERVLRERRKNVHAGVVGYLVPQNEKVVFPIAKSVPVTYNPYKYETFVHKHTEKPILNMERTIMYLHDQRPIVRAA